MSVIMPPKKKEPEKAPVEEKFHSVDVSTKDPRTVVLLLDSPETAIVCKACEALHKHAEKSEQNCTELQELDIIPRLVRLMALPDKATRAHSVLCLSVMASHGSVRRMLYKTDCIPPLLALMKPEEELICHERASFTVAELAGEYSFKVLLQKHSAQEPLVQLLQSGSNDPDVQRNCVKALSLMVEHYQTRPAVMEVGGLPVILELLESEYAIVQELALKTLHSCMQDAGCREAFRDADGLTKIVAFIGNKDYTDLHVMAVSLLAQCLEDTENMVALQSSGCLQQLTSHITSSTLPEMKRNAAMALSRAARNVVNQKILHEQEVEKTFIQLLSSEDEGVCVAGCDGLSAMASLNSSRQSIGQWGGVEAVVGVCGREEGRARGAAVQALAQIVTEAPANCKVLSQCGGVESLVQLLGDSEAQCRRCAAECITNMAADDSLRRDLISAGAVPSLVGSLSFADSAVQLATAESVGVLACDAVARQQFSGSGGVPGLLSLLRSPKPEVRQNAVWALAVCAQSTEVADLACQNGALEMVNQLMKQPGGTNTASVRAALTRLLDSNLAAKYWVTGRLEQRDVISDCEFFDAGLALSSSHPFTPLSELIKRPLNLNRSILTVNLLAKPVTPPHGEDTPSAMDASQSAVSVGSRSKSRNAPANKEGKGKKEKTRVERETESRVSGESEDLSRQLSSDPGLWTHISHAQSHIHPIANTRKQVTELAKYVSDSMGGPILKTGMFGFELSASKIQVEQQLNLLPLGEVSRGVFQHRALLFKVLCDQVGIGCSLVRGEYGRHWNTVTLMEDSPRAFVVDLVFSPGQLIPLESPEAIQYQHI